MEMTVQNKKVLRPELNHKKYSKADIKINNKRLIPIKSKAPLIKRLL
jgi:hypothetical protein